MRILDLRPRTVRWMSSLWNKGPGMRGCLPEEPRTVHLPGRWAAAIADGVTSRRISARRMREDGPLLVSVGNLALGGTGKTPVVSALSEELATAGWKGAVLTRGFGSPLTGPLKVEPENVLAGDEARLIAAGLGDREWPVIQARRRVRGLDLIVEKFSSTEVVIIEDGHQTADLGRHLDIVILDSWTVRGEGPGAMLCPVTGPVVPFGPWRESASGAVRAGILLVESDDEMPAFGEGGQSVASFTRSLVLRAPGEGRSLGNRSCRPALLSGIARPEAFEKSVTGILENDPVLTVRCGDHAEYGPRNVAVITGALEESGADHLVTTGKDWIKLKPFWPARVPVQVADLKIVWGSRKTLPELVGERLEKLREP